MAGHDQGQAQQPYQGTVEFGSISVNSPCLPSRFASARSLSMLRSHSSCVPLNVNCDA